MEDEQSLMLVMLSELIDSHDQKPTCIKSRSWIKRRNVKRYFSNIMRELMVKHRGSYRYSYVRQFYKPMVQLSVSIILRFVSKVLLSLFQRSLVLQIVGPTQQQDYRYGGQDQCIVSPTVGSVIHTPVETSVLLVLLYVGLPIRWSRPVYRKSYFLQDQ